MSEKRAESKASGRSKTNAARLAFKAANSYYRTNRERLASHEFTAGDKIAAASLIGSGLIAVAGVLAYRRHSNKTAGPDGAEMAICDQPDRNTHPHVVSLVNMDDGTAYSYPRNDEAASRLTSQPKDDLSLIVMKDGKVHRVLQEGQVDGSDYATALEDGREFLLHALDEIVGRPDGE